MAAEKILLTSALLLCWTYILYPSLVFTIATLTKKRKSALNSLHTGGESIAEGTQSQTGSAGPPFVSVLMSVFNEEKVIRAKIDSLLASDYPAHLMEIIIGSDASTDKTDDIIIACAESDRRIRFLRNTIRRGKAATLNRLAKDAKGDVFIITDANVIFSSDTVTMLVSCFGSPRTGLCDATVISSSSRGVGVTRQENLYSRFEALLKRAEGRVWETMTGPYGGCYAVRRELFPYIPENTLVDDLFVGLTVMREGFSSFNNQDAIVTEDTQPDIAGQFRRRVRIAAGSFQNLFRFGPFPSGKIRVSFAFFSHKVLRWFAPLFLAVFFMTTVILSSRSVLYFCLLAVQLFLVILSALDLVLGRPDRKTNPSRYVTQFLLMNAALTAGFVKAVRGIKNGIWEPTKRV